MWFVSINSHKIVEEQLVAQNDGIFNDRYTSFKPCTVQLTVVDLSTRPSPLIIYKSLWFRPFWTQSKTLLMIRCMFDLGSGFKTFWVQKWPFWVQNFEVSLHKITNFRGISGCQWTMPSGLFAKKIHTKVFCSC